MKNELSITKYFILNVMFKENTFTSCKGNTTNHLKHGTFENTVVRGLQAAKSFRGMTGVTLEILNEMRRVVKI